ncbi:MAG: hypothetical protein U9O94_07140, partial [Nanoarchaeota archaeon]|nr:hypothetical protein [Nanoarchaeota archaeon]
MKIETVIGVSSRVEAFDKELKKKVEKISENNDVTSVVVVPTDRMMYGVIGYKRRINRSKAKKTSSTGTKAEV